MKFQSWNLELERGFTLGLEIEVVGANCCTGGTLPSAASTTAAAGGAGGVTHCLCGCDAAPCPALGLGTSSCSSPAAATSAMALVNSYAGGWPWLAMPSRRRSCLCSWELGKEAVGFLFSSRKRLNGFVSCLLCAGNTAAAKVHVFGLRRIVFLYSAMYAYM